MRRRIALIFFAVLVILAAFFYEYLMLRRTVEEDPTKLFAYGGMDSENSKITFQTVDEEWYLFLPAGADHEKVALYKQVSPSRARKVRTWKLSEKNLEDDGAYHFRLAGFSFSVMLSEHLSSVYLHSADPESAGQKYVDSDDEHTARISGTLEMLNEHGHLEAAETLEMIRTRGNTTALLDKKAYKIKLSRKGDLLKTGDHRKSYALLANAGDPSLMRNKVAYELCAELGLPDAIRCEWVDLYWDGKYCGNYLLSELPDFAKTDAKIGAQEIAHEIQNGDESLMEPTLMTGENRYGDTFQYAASSEAPETVNGAYFVELDNAYYETEPSWFITSNGVHFVVKSPEYCSKEEMLYISELFERSLLAAENNGIDPESGIELTTCLDLSSFARDWGLQEVLGNLDAYNSSTYFYTKSGDETIFSGPLWDFDAAMGREIDNRDELATYYALYEFVRRYALSDALRETYQTEIYPLIPELLERIGGGV